MKLKIDKRMVQVDFVESGPATACTISWHEVWEQFGSKTVQSHTSTGIAACKPCDKRDILYGRGLSFSRALVRCIEKRLFSLDTDQFVQLVLEAALGIEYKAEKL